MADASKQVCWMVSQKMAVETRVLTLGQRNLDPLGRVSQTGQYSKTEFVGALVFLFFFSFFFFSCEHCRLSPKQDILRTPFGKVNKIICG